MIVNQLVILSLREQWRLLRLFHTSGSVLVDYRILKNYAARLLKEK
ncbi:YlcG family protein [Enterobacter bugandensis]|nr:YlcG family protein [Enterobacter bugandensis]